MNNKRLELSLINQIAYVRLTRAEKHNALDMPMFHDIADTIATLKKQKNLRAVILSGDGENFCTGLDIKEILRSPSNGAKLLFKWLPWHSNLAQKVSTAWRELPVPVIAVIHGRCWGGGLQIALGADFRIATPDVSLSIMEGKWGLIPDMGGTLALRELVKQDVAKELAMTAKIINGEEALALGLVSHLSEQPMELAQQMANDILLQSPDAIAGVKKLYNKSWWSSAGMALARESFYQLKIFFGKNSKIKIYNQTHDKDKARAFKQRMKW